jgi:hypothetical protein
VRSFSDLALDQRDSFFLGPEGGPFLMKEHEPGLSKLSIEEPLQLKDLYEKAGAA